MAICNHLANNGAKSDLYDALAQKYGSDKAHDYWTAIRTEQFLLNDDWMDNITDELQEHLDGNGEPSISWTEDKLGLKKQFTNHSGGANGSDTAWDTIGHEFGVDDHRHYWHGNKTPTGNVEISDTQLEEGWKHVLEANKSLNRKPEKYKSLLSRNWFQVKNADSIFAIGKLASASKMDGGTGWAVQMSIDSKKPVNVYDQEKAQWYKYDYDKKSFVPQSTPTLTRNFAGIGTRELTSLGKEAIRDVYKKTFSNEPEPKVDQQVAREVAVPPKEIVKVSLEPDKGMRFGFSNRNSEDVMKTKVKTIYDEALLNPDKEYHFDYEYKGDKFIYGSGYNAKELAGIFDGSEVPSNVTFPSELQRLINNSTKRILESLPKLDVSVINRDERAITEAVGQILLPKHDNSGNLSGYFSAQQQQDIIDSAMFATHSFLLKDPNFGANAIIKTFKGFQSLAQRDPSSDFNDIHNNRVRIAGEMLDQMSTLGYSVTDYNRSIILNAIDRLEDLKGIQSKGLEQRINDYDKDLEEPDQSNTEFIEAMGHGLKDWGEVAFEHDPKDTASSRMKMFIAMQPDMDRGNYQIKKDGILIPKPAANLDKWAQENPREVKALADKINRKGFYMENEADQQKMKSILDKNYPILPKKNSIGLTKVVDFEATFQDILETLTDSPIHDYDLYKGTLQTTGRPNLINLVQSLDNADQQIKNEFSRLVSMQYTNFQMMLFNKIEDGDGTSWVLRPILSNRYSQRNTIVKNWRENQKISDIMKINESGQRVIDVVRARDRWMPALKSLQKVDWSIPEQSDKAQKFVKDMLDISGIKMSDEMMSHLFDNIESLTKGTSVAGGLGKQFSTTQDGQPSGMFSAFIMKMAGLSNESDINDRIDSKADIESRAEMNNPLYTENTTMQILSRVSARFTPTLHSGTSKSSEGKDIWDYSMHTKLSHQIIDLKQSYDEFKARYDGVDVTKNNFLLNTIDKLPQYKDRIKLMYMDGMKPQWGKRGTTRGDMSDREQLLMSLALFQNQGDGFNKIPAVHYMSLTHSDKTMSPILMNMPKFDVGDADTTPQEVVGKMGSVFYNVFRAEHGRIVNQKSIDFNDSRYNKGKNLFYFMPEFNKESIQKMVSDGTLTDREYKTLWMNGESLTKQIGTEELAVVNKILNKVVQDRIENTIDTWTKNGIVTEDSNMFDKKYVSKLLDKNGVKPEDNKSKNISDVQSSFFKQGKALTKAEVNDIAVRHAAKEYSLNYFIHNVSMSQLFYGDPALTFKKGGTDLQSVDLTLKEYGKRLAKDIAPGLDPYFRPQDKQFNSITLKDHIQSEKYLDNLRKIFPDYQKVNATDAQEFTTVAEHLKVAYANGLIPSKTFNDMLQIVEASKGKYYEFTNPDHLSIIMQPVKPVFAGQRTAQNGAILEDYIKTSSIPLYPPATSGLELDGLRTLMESKGIDRAPFESGKKMGSPNEPVSFFSSDGSFKMPSDDSITKGTVRLDRSGFRIQQEVPYDETKETIKTVSQMNKLITEGIADIKDFSIPGHDGTMSGKEVRTLKEDIRKKMLKSQYEDFSKDFGIVNDRIQDKSKVYDKLLSLSGQDKLSLNERLSLVSRDENGNLNIPLQYNTAADALESMLMSMVKDIAQVKMPGKSFVQASSVGWKFKEDGLNNSGIVWSEGYDGSPLKTTRIENGIVKPAQVLIPFNFMNKDGIPLKVEDCMKETNGKKVIDGDKVPQELRELIGARIPNQGHSSMAAMEVVGFLPKNMGDTVIVPAGFTKQMGADFDVDKLYTYRRPYIHDAETNTFKGDKEAFSGLQSDYFNVHWGVLTHNEMAEKILKPLDKPDLKEENDLLRPTKPDGYNYFDHTTQLQDFQNGKDAKALVGMTSLAVTFNSIIQDKNLHFTRDELQSDEHGKLIKTTIRDFITFKDEHTGKELRLTNLSGNGTSHYTRGDGEDIPTDGSSIRTKADNQSTIQSAAVDNAKDRALDNLNITPDTYKAIDALMQLETEDGKAANLKYGTRLLTQPIIKEFAAEMRKGNDSLSSTYDPNLKETVINNLRRKYGGDHDPSIILSESSKVIFDPQLLKKTMSMDPNSEQFAIHQIAALDLFDKLYQIGDRKSQLQSYFNQDTQGAGPNILSALDKSDKMTRLDQSPISNALDIFQGPQEPTEQGLTAQLTTGVATGILTQLLPYDKYTPLFSELIGHSGKSSMSIDNQRDVLRAVRSFTYNSGEHWWRNADAERGRLFYSQGDVLSLARRVEEAKRTWGKDNYFLQRLDPVIGDTTSSPDYLEYQAVTVGRIDEGNNDRAFTELLMSKDSNQRVLGEDLLRYAYLTGGVQDQNSFVKFVPNSYIANTDFGNMLKMKGELLDGHNDNGEKPNLDMPGFAQQYLQHYPERAFNIGREIFGDIPSEQNYPESFRYDIDDEKQQRLNSGDSMREFVSYRSNTEGKWILYHLNPTSTGEVYYTRVDILGNKYTDEYNGEVNSMKRSIFTENRSMAMQLPEVAPLAQLRMNIYSTYEHSNPFMELKVTYGSGEDHMNEALDAIKSNERVPESLRNVASILKEAPLTINERDAKEIFGISYHPNIMINAEIDADGMAYTDGTIVINPNTHGIAHAAETFLHEMVHQRVMSSIMLSGYDSRMVPRTEEGRKRLEALQDKFANDHPSAINHIRELDRIRLDTLNKLRSEIGEEKYNSALDSIENAKSLDHSEALVYGLHSLQEFVTHVMTDKNTQDYLENIKTEKGSWLQRVWGKITSLLSSIIGRDIKEDSALHDALYHTISLTTGDYYKNDNITESIINGRELRVPDYAQAHGLAELGEQTYGHDVDVKKDELGYSISLSKLKKSNLAGPIGRISDKLKDQLDKAYKDISKGDQHERIQARARYNELRQGYNDVLREQNMSTISQIADKQLKWVEKVMNNPGSSATQVQAAIDTSNIWGESTEIMYGNTNGMAITDPTMATLEQQANIYRVRLINKNAVDVVTKALDGKVNFVPADMNTDLKEVPQAQALFLTLARVKPKLISGIGALTKEAADSKDEHMHRVHNNLMDIEKRMNKAGITPDKFMQKDSWGLLDRLSNGWHEHMSDLHKNREDALDDIAKTEKLTDDVRKNRQQQVWKKYWDDVKKVGGFVDTRIFFDNDKGTRKTGPDVDKAFNDLVTKVGSKDYAKELLDKAHEKYQDYVNERKIQRDYLDSQIQLSDEEKNGKSYAEQENTRLNYVNGELNRWLEWNSPHRFLDKMGGSGDTKYINNGDRWVVMAPKADSGYYDKDYDELMKNDKVAPIFNDYKSLIQEMTSYLPPEHSEKLPSGFFPLVSNETITSLSSMIAKMKNWDSTLLNKFTATEAEEYARLKPDEIPIMYTRETGYTKDKANRSTDLIKVAQAFSNMSLHYRYMAPILDQVNVAESIVKEANRQRLNGNQEGPVLRNALDTIKYNKDKLIFNKPQELEGKIDSPIYSGKPWEHIKIERDIKKLNQEKNDLQQKIREKQDNGEFDYDEENKQVDKINKKLDEYDKNARYIYASKAVDAVISINQMKALSYNPFSALSNFTFAMVSTHVYATGRTDYDPSHLRQAMGIATHAMKNYYTFGAGMDSTARKIRALMERSQVMTEIGLSGRGGVAQDPSHLKEALSPFNWQKSGDYYAKGVTMIAMMLKQTANLVDRETGETKQVSIWDAMDENGRLDTTKYQDDPNWYHEDVAQQKDWNKFRDKMRGVATIVFGNQDKNSPLMAKKSMLWRLVGQFRMSWFPEGLNSRFGSERFDPILGRDVKGRYRSYGTMGLMTSGIIMARSLLDMLPGINIDRFKGLTDKEGNAIKDVDMENMRRNFAGLAWTVSIIGSIAIMKALMGSGTKGKQKTDDQRYAQLLINMLERNQQDLLTYSSPTVWDTITGNVIPATTVVTDTYKAIKATNHYLFGDTSKDKHAAKTWLLKITKATPILNNINKANYMFNRDLDAIQR